MPLDTLPEKKNRKHTRRIKQEARKNNVQEVQQRKSVRAA